MLDIFLIARLLSLRAFSLILAWLSLPPPGDSQSGRVLSVIFESQSYLGPREWSPLARWTFREFNEVRRRPADGSNGSLAKCVRGRSVYHSSRKEVHLDRNS